MISYVYFIGQCFKFRICLYYVSNNLKNAILLYGSSEVQKLEKQSLNTLLVHWLGLIYKYENT